MPVLKLVSRGEEAVPEPRILLLVADLLEDVGEQVLCFCVVRLSLDELVHDLRGEQIFPFVVQLLAASENLLAPPIIST